MSHQIPEDAQRLTDRLRKVADEIESAARLGVPAPDYLSVSGNKHGSVYIPADEHEFAAWVEYAEAEVREYQHDGARWSSADADINGLAVHLAVKHEDPAVVA